MRVQMLILSFEGLENVANLVNVKKKLACLGGWPTRLAAGSPFCGGRVTFLADPTFLHINTLTRPAGSTRSRRDNLSMCEHCWLGQKGQLFFPLTQLEGEPLFRNNFSSCERGLKGWDKTTAKSLIWEHQATGTHQCCKGVFLCTYFEILHCFEFHTEQAGLAQSVERMTAEREVAGSIPGAGPLLRVF